MLLMLGTSVPEIRRFKSPLLGRLLSPRRATGIPHTIKAGITWAADNDCFNANWDAGLYASMLGRLHGHSGCKFVTAPDVVADAKRTMDLFHTWEPAIHALGLPVALVAQDGVESLEIPWGKFEALFIGGSTTWKLGRSGAVPWLVKEAKERGLWVHMGRVNLDHRIRYARMLGCDSFDGTALSAFPRKYVPGALMELTHPYFNYEEVM